MPSKMDILMKFDGALIEKALRFVAPLLCFAVIANLTKTLMLGFQTRQGQQLYDPVLSVLGPWNLNIPIFLLTYIPIIVGILLIFRDGVRRNRLIYSYCLLQIFRLSCIHFVPLEPPAGMIVLNDPISDRFVFGTTVTKDLFFSGHVSTLVLFAFFFKNPKMRWFYRFLALADAFCLMGQHVHYFVDVLFAPLFACLAYYAVLYGAEMNTSMLRKLRALL